jgi:small subunit ribosomal protein S1
MPDYDNISKWADYLPISLGWALFIILLLGVIFKLEAILYFLSIVQGWFLWLGTGVKRKQIENSIKANIIKVSKMASKEIEDALPYDLKIKWVKTSEREAFFDGNKVVVCMDNKRNKMHSIVHTVNDYVSSALLVKEKSCIDKSIYKSSCLVMTRKLLMDTYEDGVTFFFDNILNIEMEKDEALKNSINKLINLDDNGMFVQILLRELKERSSIVFGKTDNSNFIDETKSFINFLHDIAVRKFGDDSTKLSFRGVYYKVGVILVAKPITFQMHGESSYIKRFKQKVIEGMDSIYLCARNEKVNILESVLKEINKMNYIKSYKIKYKKRLTYTGKKYDRYPYTGVYVHIKLEKKKDDKKIKNKSA